MRIVNVGVLAPSGKGIPLGVQGENCATQVRFDVRAWLREYPSGTVSAVAKRQGDAAPYPLTLDVSDGTAAWDVTDTDTAHAGTGQVELTMTVGQARVRSLTFKTLTVQSLTDAPVDDEAWYKWLDKAVVKVDEAVQGAKRTMDGIEQTWNDLKTDIGGSCEDAKQAAKDAADEAHDAKVDAKAAAKAAKEAQDAAAATGGSAGQAATSAEQAAQSAAAANASAQAAAEYSTSASNSAQTATFQAGAAKEAATAVQNKIDSANKFYDAVVEKVEDAQAARDAAATSATNAKTSETNAATSETNAASSASAAAKSASDAAASVDAINVIAPKTVNKAAASDATGVAIGHGASAAKYGAVAIGISATTAGEGVAIGDGASAQSNGVAVGHSANAAYPSSVAIGVAAQTQKQREASFGTPATDSAAETTREITHVSTPTADTSAATKKYVDDAKVTSVAPATVTTVPTATGANSIAIGDGAEAIAIGSNESCIAVGAGAKASGNMSTAIGYHATVDGYNNSVAIGTNSTVKAHGVVSIGSDTIKRRIMNVEDPRMDYDAVNLKYFTENSTAIPALGFDIKTENNGALTEETAINLNRLSDGVYRCATPTAQYVSLSTDGSGPVVYCVLSGSLVIVGGIIYFSEVPILKPVYIVGAFIGRDAGTADLIMNNATMITCFIDTTKNLPTGVLTAAWPQIKSDVFNVMRDAYGAYICSAKLDSAKGGLAVSSSGLYVPAATTSSIGAIKASDSITVDSDGIAKVNPDIFGDGLSVTDGQVSMDKDFVGEHLAGDALYYDQTDGLMLKVGQGLHIQNDELDIDQANLPLASAATRGTVRVGDGLAVDDDGVLSVSAGTPLFASGEVAGTAVTGTGLKATTLKDAVTVKNGSKVRVMNASAAVTTTATFTAGTYIDVSIAPGTANELFFSNAVCSTDGLSVSKVTLGTTIRVTLAVASAVASGTAINLSFF